MDIEKVKRYSLLEIALLLILVVGFLIAQVIVKDRGQILLTEPIPLFGSGVSVSMPAGWESTGGWKYEKTQNSMFLVGQLRLPGSTASEVRWRYFFAAEKASEMDRLQQRAKQNGAVIQSTGTIDGERPILYARLFSNSTTPQDCFMGVICLDFGRSIELLVRSYGTGATYTENLFVTLASSFEYQLPQQVRDGSELMGELIRDLTQASSSSQTQEEAFLVQNTFNKNLGFYYSNHLLYTHQAQPLCKLQIQQYERSVFRSVSSLWLSLAEQKYQWETELYLGGQSKPSLLKVIFDGESEVQIFRDGNMTGLFSAGHMVLPEPLLGDYSKIFLKSSLNDVIIDVISATGQLVPVQLAKFPLDQAALTADEVVSVIRVDYLNHPESFEELFYDKAAVLLGKFERQPGREGRLWEAVTPEQLEGIFETEFRRVQDEVAFNDPISNQ